MRSGRAAPAEKRAVLTWPDRGGPEAGSSRIVAHCAIAVTWATAFTSEGLARARVDGVEDSLWRTVRLPAEHTELRRSRGDASTAG